MAEIVLGIATSHTPLLTLPAAEWHNRAAADYANPRLNLSDGRFVTYAELAAEAGEPFADVATDATFQLIAARCQTWLDRLADDLAAAEVDVVIIVGDDQSELYSAGNTPAVAIFWGEEVVTHCYDDDRPDWFRPVAEGYAMDVTHRFPGHPALAEHIVTALMDRAIDVAVCRDVPDPAAAGFGHAFGFPVERLFHGRPIPIIPVMLNTYYPPNVVSSARAYDIGVAIAAAVAASPLDLRIAVLGSGGLSHFVVDEVLDRTVIDSLGHGGAAALRAIPRQALHEGSSEILNWIVTAGAVAELPVAWVEYEAIRRTPAGTGIGVGFASWRKPA